MFHRIFVNDIPAGSPSNPFPFALSDFPALRDGFFISYYVNSDSRTGFSSIPS
jgi:hypothetical protein